jgi:alkylation response protein AidB-like acyl-CoA dehydrogenase
VINGNKMFATNGNIANYIVVFCQTDPENPSRHERHSFILVETDTPGYTSKKIIGKMGIRASDTAEIVLRNVRVPLANLVGKEGKGFHELMAFFNRTRLHICAQAVGVARAAIEESIRHAKSTSIWYAFSFLSGYSI